MIKNKTVKVVNKGGPIGFTLFVAWIGALVYFVEQSHGFGGFIVAVLKSLVWPAYMMHRILELLHL